MADQEKRVVSVGSRLSKFIGAKATREKKLQAAAMQAEFTLRDTLIILCYLSRDPDNEISSQARKNLIPAARNWFTRPDRPELPEPIHEIVMKVIEKIGVGTKDHKPLAETDTVYGNIGLLGLGEIIQAVDHNSRTVWITLNSPGGTANVFTENGKVIGATCGEQDGMDALFRAFGWADADFKYLHAPPGDFKNRIKVNTLNLIMDALERAPDEDPFENEASRTWRVNGHLKVMNIFEIAEIFEMNAKQAICHLKRNGDEGYLFFNNGRIINASLADMTGMDAACHLLSWPNATFLIQRGGEGTEEVIHVGMQNLIIEAMRLLDEGITGSDKIASELAVINELFEGRDLITLPVLEKVRLVFSEDQRAREALEADSNSLVRKAIKVKISKTVHKYLNPATEHETRIRAAQGNVPLSTTEKLVLLSYLSHDESQQIREEAKKTLEALDVPTYRKGFGSDLHPAVMDFLVRETIRDESLIKLAASTESLLEETALYILNNWKSEDVFRAILGNRKLLERSPVVSVTLASQVSDPELKKGIDDFEEAILLGQTEMKVEGPLSICGIGGLMRAAHHGMRSGTIVLESGSDSGRIYFNRGKIIGAIWKDVEGIPALETMLGTKELRFRYLLRTYFHTENLDPSVAEELLEKTVAGPASGLEQTGLRIVSGSLQTMDIFEALSAVEGTPVPVSMSLICEEGSGEIYRDRSRILNVNVNGKESPLSSMAALISWNGIRFIMRPSGDNFSITVDKPLHELFTDAIKLIPNEMSRATRPGELPEWELSESEFESLYNKILNLGVAEKIKLALMGNREARDILVRDANRMVAVAVVKSPKIQESEIESISKSRQISEEVLRQIAATKEWTKSYSIKLNLVSNSKTPIPIAMKFLTHIREPDLRKLAKSKNVSGAVASQARRLLETKTSH
jgi:hypothetical protein